MWLTRYPRPTEIMHDQGSEFIRHEFIKSLIEMECRIIANLSTLGNPTYSAILERIIQVLGNLVRNCNIKETHVDDNDPYLVILVATVFSIFSTENISKCYSLVQLVFFRDIILPIKYTTGW